MNDQESFEALHAWFETDQGAGVANAFYAEIYRFLHLLEGETLVQLGSCGENPWQPLFQYTHQWLVSPCLIPFNTTLQSVINRLPFERDSIDCVLAPLSLNACSPERNLIDEIDRILKPMGYVIFFGINPLSFWGIWARLNKLACFKKLVSSVSLNRAMLNRGYRQCSLTGFYYIPPVQSKDLISKFSFLEAMGKMIGPIPAGFHCLVMQKYQFGNIGLLEQTAKEEVVIEEKQPLHPVTSTQGRRSN